MHAANSKSARAVSLAEAIEQCRRVTKREARNFYYGLKLLPEPKRSALYVLYAWMRAVDDLVDGDPRARSIGIVEERLESFRVRTQQALAHDDEGASPEPSPHGLFLALRHVAERFPLSRDLFDDMVEGQLDDLSHRPLQAFEELREYCYRVASTVGLLCVEVWGAGDARARELAIDRGIAFQLTNILRDIAADHAAGRTYLPADELAQHGLTMQSLLGWSEPRACAAFMQMQVARARSFYEASHTLEQLISADCRPTLWAMTQIYRGVLERIARDPRQAVCGSAARIGTVRKVSIALRAKWLRPTMNGTPRDAADADADAEAVAS